MAADSQNSFKYLWMIVISFIMMGFVPIYWALLSHVNSYTVLIHRSVWTSLSILPFLILNGNYRTLLPALKKSWPFLLLSTFFIAINWLTYIYAISQHYLFEASLAYFIAPLISIVLGLVFLKESVSIRQSFAVLLAVLAIVFLLISKGIIPKYALIVAISFSFYGLLGKKIDTSPVTRMFIESCLLTVFLFIFFCNPSQFCSVFFTFDFATKLYLILSGAVTFIPMSLYILSVKQVKFATAGILSFILPTVIFLVGIIYFHEQVDRHKLFSIFLIWGGVGLYILDLLKMKKTAVIKDQVVD